MKPPAFFVFSTRSHCVWLLLFSGLWGCSGPREAAIPEPASEDHILAVVGESAVTVQEFERQYTRTSGSGPGADTREDYEDFLQRYVDYKLKVLEARRLGYHELPDVEEEIQNYRSQLVRPYLLGKEVTRPLLMELYERRLEAVDISHILISVPESAPPEDTLQAFSTLAAVRDSITTPDQFRTMAIRYSQDPSASRDSTGVGYGGRLGYFGGGRLVESFENHAFDTPTGTMSPVFRSPFGYHILYVHDRKAMPAERRLAHIMIRAAPATALNESALASIESRIRTVEQRLADGEPFAEVARELSDDRNSAQNGGDMGFVAYDAGLPPSMQKAAWDLEIPGTVSGPVRTQFGTHFIMFLEERPTGSFEEEEDRLSELLKALPRLKAAETEFAASLVDSVGMSLDSSIVQNWVQSMEPDSLYRTLFQGRLPQSELQRDLVSLGDSTYSVAAFVRWFGQNPSNASLPPDERLFGAIRSFVEGNAIDYEVVTLEQREAEFRQTMQEFRDGMILFRLMEDSVWTAASNDTTGLRSLYMSSRDTLRFGDRIRTVSLSSASEESLSQIVRLVRDGQTLAEALNLARQDSTIEVRSDTTLVEARTGSLFDGVLDLQENEILDPIPYQNGVMTLYHDGLEPAREKTFEEARADLIGIHQANVEKALLQRLRERYHVRIWPERLEGMFASGAPSRTGS